MFGRRSDTYRQAQDTIDTLASSFLRGSVHDSREARNALGDKLAALVAELEPKEREHLRGYRPTIVTAFPREGRQNFQSFLTHAFS